MSDYRDYAAEDAAKKRAQKQHEDHVEYLISKLKIHRELAEYLASLEEQKSY